jgi:hypothetical protein
MIRQKYSLLPNYLNEEGIFGFFSIYSAYEDKNLVGAMLNMDLAHNKQTAEGPVSLYFEYNKIGDSLVLYGLGKGASKLVKFGEDSQMVPKLLITFPCETTLESQNGIFRYPFLTTKNKTSYFEFPDKYENDYDLMNFFNRCPEGVRKVN